MDTLVFMLFFFFSPYILSFMACSTRMPNLARQPQNYKEKNPSSNKKHKKNPRKRRKITWLRLMDPDLENVGK